MNVYNSVYKLLFHSMSPSHGHTTTATTITRKVCNVYIIFRNLGQCQESLHTTHRPCYLHRPRCEKK